jgi:hypothetical protein
LNQFDIQKNYSVDSLLHVIYEMDDRVFLTNEEVKLNKISIEYSFVIDKDKLLNNFEENLRNKNLNFYINLLSIIYTNLDSL